MPNIIFNVPRNLEDGKPFEPIAHVPSSVSANSKLVLSITTGESEFIRTGDEAQFLYSGATTTCLQICLYGVNSKGQQEVCLIHWNQSFELDWGSIVEQFTCSSLQMKIIGAAHSGILAEHNLRTIQASIKAAQKLKSASATKQSTDPTITISLANQCVGDCNTQFRDVRDLLWDLSGNCYDAASLKLAELPNVGLRIAREKEAEVREWLGRHTKMSLNKPPIQLKANTGVIFRPHYFTLALIHRMQKENRIPNYYEVCSVMDNGDPNSLRAQIRVAETKYFVQQCLTYIKQIGFAPSLPMSEVQLACQILGPKQFQMVVNPRGQRQMATVAEKVDEGISIRVIDDNEFVLFGFTVDKVHAKTLAELSQIIGGDGKRTIFAKDGNHYDVPLSYVLNCSRYYKIQHPSESEEKSGPVGALQDDDGSNCYIALCHQFSEYLDSNGLYAAPLSLAAPLDLPSPR